MSISDDMIKGEAICDFLQEQGGTYKTLDSEVVRNVYWSLGAGHYVWKPGEYFACYWCIHPKDVEGVKQRIKPADIVNGTVMYVAEAASTVGIAPIIKTLRAQAQGMAGLFWHRPAKQDKVYWFPSQKGGM